MTIRGRANLMASLSGYGKTIKLHSGDALLIHRTQDRRVVILEYEVHGKIVSSGAAYDNRFISVVTIENSKIVRWRDYMDSLAAWTALNGAVYPRISILPAKADTLSFCPPPESPKSWCRRPIIAAGSLRLRRLCRQLRLSIVCSQMDVSLAIHRSDSQKLIQCNC
jgi:hypothetical protein